VISFGRYIIISSEESLGIQLVEKREVAELWRDGAIELIRVEVSIVFKSQQIVIPCSIMGFRVQHTQLRDIAELRRDATAKTIPFKFP